MTKINVYIQKTILQLFAYIWMSAVLSLKRLIVYFCSVLLSTVLHKKRHSQITWLQEEAHFPKKKTPTVIKNAKKVAEEGSIDHSSH